MIPITIFRNRTVVIFGLARSGLEAARALMEGGAEVICSDDARPRVIAAEAQGFPTADLTNEDWSRFGALVLSPGVPLTHPEPHWTVVKAREAGVEIIGDTELFFRERAAKAADTPVIAVTGTNGKSTTTALVGHILNVAGRPVSVGGNIGAAVLGLERFGQDRAYSLEMSSFQIDLTPTLNPSVGILLNVAPDHLDRHGSMENYAAIKARMLERSDASVVAVDDDWTVEIAAKAEARGVPVLRVSATRKLENGVYVQDGRIFRAKDGDEEQVADISQTTTLRGDHNAQNAAAATAAALTAGVDGKTISAALQTFPGLAHRMEQVGRLGKVLFINDSKATNADATGSALASFEAIYWIAGGRPKEGGIESLRPFFPRVRRAFLIGEAAKGFAETLGAEVPHEISRELATAVADAAHAASKDAAAEPVVLLAPACASFDQFADFEARGEAFRRLVSGLDGVVMSGKEAA